MKIMKSTNIELSMLQQIEEHMKQHNISYAEFTRRAAASYLDVSTVSINDSEPDNTPNVNKNDFNWEGIKL